MSGVIKTAARTVFRRRLGRAALGLVAATAIAGSMLMWQTPPASAHCDSTSGPVVTAAREALETGDVDLVLPYVQPEQEAELEAAFDKTLEMRKGNAADREFADNWFFETTVRLHRVGEGASYTGLKEDEPLDPALEAAETALEQGSLDGVYEYLDHAVRDGVQERYQAVLDARAAEEQNPTVETARERVEAEFSFEKYVLGIGGAISENLHEEAAAGGHEH